MNRRTAKFLMWLGSSMLVSFVFYFSPTPEHPAWAFLVLSILYSVVAGILITTFRWG